MTSVTQPTWQPRARPPTGLPPPRRAPPPAVDRLSPCWGCRLGGLEPADIPHCSGAWRPRSQVGRDRGLIAGAAWEAALSQAFRGRGTARALLQARRGWRCSGGPGGASETSHESEQRQQPALRPPDSTRPSEVVTWGDPPPRPRPGLPCSAPTPPTLGVCRVQDQGSPVQGEGV